MSTSARTQVGRFVWHEALSPDVEKSRSFYTELFGWGIEVWKPGEMDYQMINVNGENHGGFYTLDPERGAPSHWIGHVLVDDADATAGRVEKGGGTILMGPMSMPEIGRFALIRDPQGGVVSAFQPEGEGPIPEGVFVWDELLTEDPEAAKRFYTGVFGWTTSDMDMGDMVYTLFRRSGDADVAGLMRKPDDMPVSAAWVTYLATDDVDATVTRAGELGATTLVPAMDIPDVGRFAMLSDPAGATFGLFKPKGNQA